MSQSQPLHPTDNGTTSFSSLASEGGWVAGWVDPQWYF